MMMIKCIVVLAAVALSAAEEMHTTLNDNHDVESVVKNPQELAEFTYCFIYEGPCTELTASFRANMADAVSEACRRCNNDQKHTFRVYLDGLEKNNPQLFKKYIKYYDPKGDNMGPLRKELSGY